MDDTTAVTEREIEIEIKIERGFENASHEDQTISSYIETFVIHTPASPDPRHARQAQVGV